MTTQSFMRLSVILALFLGVTYTLCVLYGLTVAASFHMYPAWQGLLPGFWWLSWGSYFIGLGEVLAYGVYAAGLYLLIIRLVSLKSR